MLKFTKMQGLGNDFVVVDAVRQLVDLNPEQVRRLADRHFGIGADQILIIERSKNDADFNYRIFNADGNEAEQCLNGIRCVAHYLQQKKNTRKKQLKISCLGGISQVSFQKNGKIIVTLPHNAKPIAIPEILKNTIPIEILGAVNIGNPHLILRVDSIINAPLHLAELITRKRYFRNGINITFVEIVTPSHIKLRTYERGSGETLSCSSGATATVITGRALELLEKNVKVEFSSGILEICHESPLSPVFLKGNAKIVFEGQFSG